MYSTVGGNAAHGKGKATANPVMGRPYSTSLTIMSFYFVFAFPNKPIKSTIYFSFLISLSSLARDGGDVMRASERCSVRERLRRNNSEREPFLEYPLFSHALQSTSTIKMIHTRP